MNSLYHCKSTYKYCIGLSKSTKCFVTAEAVAEQGCAVPQMLSARQGTNTQALSKLIMIQVPVYCPSWECQ